VEEIDRQRASPWKEGFLFVGNNIALDFLNTHPVLNGGPVELLPDFDALLGWFQAEDLLSSRNVMDMRRKWGDSAAARDVLHHLQEWRERFRSAMVAWEAGHALPKAILEELNRLLAEYPMLMRLTPTRRHLVSESWFQSQTPEELFAPIAHSAAMLLATADPRRIRKCGNCVLQFLDTSKKGTRRWCSMELCGNRLKVAAYTERQRRAESRG
jgi:predicted RNA-binding Zn ribbon-like protein